VARINRRYAMSDGLRYILEYNSKEYCFCHCSNSSSKLMDFFFKETGGKIPVLIFT
jgi:hypothetical protein